jgi:hypothetical protein
MTTNYDFNYLTFLCDQISNINNKIFLKKIYNTILKYNPNLKYDEDNHNIHIKFNCLQPITYEKINIILNNYNDKKKLKYSSSNNSQNI